MGICAKELRHYVVRPTLKHLGVWSKDAEELILATAAQESGLGFHIKQKHHSGIGVYHIDPKTHQTIWDQYLVEHPEKASAVRGFASQHEFLNSPHAELATNLSYATAIAWCIYERAGYDIPNHREVDQMAKYWKKYYHNGKNASCTSFIRNYQAYVGQNHLAA